MFKAAMFFRPCQAERRFPSVNFSSILFLYFSLAASMARLTSSLTSFFSDSEPVKKDPLLFVKDFFEPFGNPWFIVGEDCDSFGGNDAVHTE